MTLYAAHVLSVSPLPIGSAVTYHPTHGGRVHPHLTEAAAYVVRNPGARILSSTEPLTLAAEAALLEEARASLGTPAA